MSLYERSRQQLDPIGAFGNSLTTVLFTLGAFGIAALLVVQGIDQITNPPLAVIALLLLGVSCVHLVLASNPIRAPFTRRTMAIILITCMLACAFELGSQWETTRPAIGWGPIALGLLFLAMGPYRPSRELGASGFIVAVFFGFLAVVHSGSDAARAAVDQAPVLATVAVTIMPILAFSFAVAAHSRAIVESLERWQRKLLRPGRVVSRDDEDGIARSVQQDRVTILNREVLPFFLEIIDKPAISNGDRERARDIASSIRKVMVAEVDRSWLEHAVDQLTAGDRGISPEQLVRDDDHIANHMSYDQRTALRAFIVALHQGAAHEAGFMKIELFRDGGLFRAVMVAELEIADYSVRSRFAPYFAVLRVIFTDLRLEYLHGVLTLSFSYEQR